MHAHTQSLHSLLHLPWLRVHRRLACPFVGSAGKPLPGYRIHLDQATHVNASGRHAWVRAALIVGVVYFIVGKVFALPANHIHVWRLAAWMVSGVAYAAHIAYEHFRLRSSPRLTAPHVAVAVAIGAFALAVAGMIHSLSTSSSIRPAWLLALVIWPAVTALPAFLGALVAAAILPRRSVGPEAE
jgi:hypothetical protein